jgi:CRP-like cAMP-binding protein
MLNRATTPIDSPGWEPQNRLLAALSSRALLSLQPHLEFVSLAGESVLFDPDEPLKRVYFVETGAVSLVTPLENRVTVGAAMVGPEGGAGIAAVLMGGDVALSRCQVLVPGSALAVEVSAFRRTLRHNSRFRTACAVYTQSLVIQLLQAVPCNRLHTMTQRCARWLLMCADRVECDTFELAQNYLAKVLGVPPSTLAVVVRKLENDGLICCSPSAITVADRQGLETAACECYRIVRDQHERLRARAFN